jgi:hypothetical protein
MRAWLTLILQRASPHTPTAIASGASLTTLVERVSSGCVRVVGVLLWSLRDPPSLVFE